MSDSLQPHGLYSPWTSPGQDTGVGSLSLLQLIFLSQELNWGLQHCRWIIFQLRYQGSHNRIYHVAIYCSHQNYFQKSECSRDRKHTLGEQCNSPIKNIINSYEVTMYTVCNQIPLYDWVWKSSQRVYWIPSTHLCKRLCASGASISVFRDKDEGRIVFKFPYFKLNSVTSFRKSLWIF